MRICYFAGDYAAEQDQNNETTFHIKHELGAIDASDSR